MSALSNACLPACALAMLLAAGVGAAAAAPAEIAGRVVDGEQRPVAGAHVILCDHRSGVPLHAATLAPFTQALGAGGQRGDPTALAEALTDADGRFTLEAPADRPLRLIAQRWPDEGSPAKRALDAHGQRLELWGIAAGVVAPADDVVIAPLGDAALRVRIDAPNDDCLLVVSSAPLAADPILGFASWSGAFIPEMLAGSRIAGGELVVTGLPPGEVHLALFANDDRPGFGGASALLQAGAEVDVAIPIVAGWTNGHREPPARLVPLVERMRGWDDLCDDAILRDQVPRLVGPAPESLPEAVSRLVPHLDREITLPDGSAVPLKDWLAARGYLALQEAAARRAARAKAREAGAGE